MDYLANLALSPAELGSAEGRGTGFLPGDSAREAEASVEKGGEICGHMNSQLLFLVKPELYLVYPAALSPDTALY